MSDRNTYSAVSIIQNRYNVLTEAAQLMWEGLKKFLVGSWHVHLFELKVLDYITLEFNVEI